MVKQSDIELAKEFDKKNPVPKDYETDWEDELKRPVKPTEEMQRLHKKAIDDGFLPPPLKINNYLENVYSFHKIQPFFYDRAGIFWFWKENRYEQVDDIDVMNTLDTELKFYGQTVSTSVKNQYLEAMKRVGRQFIPKDAPTKWVQFKDIAFSISSKKTYKVKPNYFFTNPIPWEISDSDETPTLDRLFTEWVGKDNVQVLYELVAYCCYTDYPIQLLFCLIGAGRNGKGCFLRVLDKFLGKDNVTTTSLDLIAGRNKSRFESFKLYKKLVALMGETNFGLLENTSLLKQLTGGDKIGFEKKGKGLFDDYNYAKVIIASNSLPTTTDTSDGFFRRWMIIEFKQEFPEGKDITKTIPEEEYSNLAKKVCCILPDLVSRGEFTNQGNIEERKLKYVLSSNPLPLFLKACCILGDDESHYISYSELYTAYIHYLKIHKKRRVKMKEFKSALEDEGYWIDRSNKKVGIDDEGYSKFKTGYWIEGITLKRDWKEEVMTIVTIFSKFEVEKNSYVREVQNTSQSSQLSQKKLDSPQETKVKLQKLPESKQEVGKCGYCGKTSILTHKDDDGNHLCGICKSDEETIK